MDADKDSLAVAPRSNSFTRRDAEAQKRFSFCGRRDKKQYAEQAIS